MDQQFLASLSKTELKTGTFDEVNKLVSSPLFPKAQEEALKSIKSLLNLLGFLQCNFPNLFSVFKEEPILLKAVLYGNALRCFEPENDSYEGNVKPSLDEKDYLAIESVF